MPFLQRGCDRRVVFRDDLVFAIWDRYPVSDGHLLVITKRHFADWFEATEEEQRAVLLALERGRQIILERHAADGFNVGVNIGTAAGQTIPHLHVHLIPRFAGDVPDPTGGVRLRHSQPGQLPEVAPLRNRSTTGAVQPKSARSWS